MIYPGLCLPGMALLADTRRDLRSRTVTTVKMRMVLVMKRRPRVSKR